MDNWSYYKKPLTAHELLEEIEKIDDVSQLPDSVVFYPPINANGENTDEDSGEDDDVTMDNLPGSQLNAPAEAIYGQKEDNLYDSEDELPLSNFLKEKHFKKKPRNFSWEQKDLLCNLPQWQEDYSPKNQQSPVEIFTSFLDDSLIEMLVDQSNLYASQRNRGADITVDEMKCFIGVLLLSGYNCFPRRKMYWENNSDCGNKLVYSAISRNRFNVIMQNFHSNNNLTLDATDKFSKIRLLIEALNKKFMELAPNEECHSIDECMVPYFGRHGTKQFIRGKPIRWGYKLWVGATAHGYIEWFEPYQGSSTKLPDKYKDLGLGASVVFTFSDILLENKGKLPFHLFFDNYFTGIDLLQILSERDLKATGTIRENRIPTCPLSLSKALKKTLRGTFEYVLEPSKNILITKWNDNSVVNIATNAGSVSPLANVSRYSQQQKKRISIDQPHVIKTYNQNMGGVDRADQNISLYRVSIRGKKWYFPLVCQCIDMIEQNAWQIHRQNGGTLDHLAFRRYIAQGLLESHKKITKRGPLRTTTNIHEHSRYDRMDHIIIYQENQSRCGQCHKKVQFRCKKCDVALHPKLFRRVS